MNDKLCHCRADVSARNGGRPGCMIGRFLFCLCLALAASGMAMAANVAAAAAGAGDAAGEVMMASSSVARLAEQAKRMLPRREYDAALDTINYGLSIDPAYIPLWRMKAMAHIGLGQNEEAGEALRVCLLRDPLDVEANLLTMRNIMDWPDLDRREKVVRVSEFIKASGTELFADMLAVFVDSREFPSYLSILLPGWRKSNVAVEHARKVLNLYSGCHFAEAAALMSAPEAETLGPRLAEALRTLISQSMARNDTSIWMVDLGSLAREDGRLVLSAEPERESFAWLRMSPGWRNLSASFRYDGSANIPRSLYLRYTASDSYLRVSLVDGQLVIQERVPDFGLTTILEYPAANLAGGPLKVVLKGERLTIFSNGKSLVESPLPVTSAIGEGRVAIGCENRSRVRSDAAFADVAIHTLDDHWRTVTGREPRENLAAILNDERVTGIMIPVDAAPRSDPALPAVLLSAVNSGITAYAKLPAGSLDLALIRRPLEALPKVLADRIWSGVVLQPKDNADWRQVEAALAEAAAAKLGTGLVLTPRLAESLLASDRKFQVDWLLLVDENRIPVSTLNGLSGNYVKALLENPQAPEQFLQYLY